jgi:hypothetical protein
MATAPPPPPAPLPYKFHKKIPTMLLRRGFLQP